MRLICKLLHSSQIILPHWLVAPSLQSPLAAERGIVCKVSCVHCPILHAAVSTDSAQVFRRTSVSANRLTSRATGAHYKYARAPISKKPGSEESRASATPSLMHVMSRNRSSSNRPNQTSRRLAVLRRGTVKTRINWMTPVIHSVEVPYMPELFAPDSD